MSRKGFPESYDVRRLLQFLAELKAGEPVVRAPVYSHLTYDIVPDDEIILRSPDIVIVEGLNVLQAPARRGRTEPSVVVSDFFDFTIYVDAEVERHRAVVPRPARPPARDRAARSRSRSSTSSRSTPRTTRVHSARPIWREVNEVNLHENIEPTKGRAHLVLEKGADHRVAARAAT